MKASERRALDEHVGLHNKIEGLYKKRDDAPAALDVALSACYEQIKRSASYRSALKSCCAGILPIHLGYRQLAIVREKQGRFTEALELSQRAHAEGWQGDWDRRINRLQKKLDKAKMPWN